jgi:hypothetical protein
MTMPDHDDAVLGLSCGLTKLISWETVLSAPRNAGGHEEIMRAIFGSKAKVIAWWEEQYHEGTIAIAYRLADGRIVVMTDYYGSCSGCDIWEGATDESVKDQVHNLVNRARVFATLKAAKRWCSGINVTANPEEHPFEAARNLWPNKDKAAPHAWPLRRPDRRWGAPRRAPALGTGRRARLRDLQDRGCGQYLPGLRAAGLQGLPACLPVPPRTAAETGEGRNQAESSETMTHTIFWRAPGSGWRTMTGPSWSECFEAALRRGARVAMDEHETWFNIEGEFYGTPRKTPLPLLVEGHDTAKE